MSNPRNRILASTALALVLAAPLGYLAKGHLTAMAATSAEPAATQFAPAVAIPAVAAPANEPAAISNSVPATATEPAPSAQPAAATEQTAIEPAVAPDPLAALDPADRAVAEKIRDLLANKGRQALRQQEGARGGRGVLPEPQSRAALARQGRRECACRSGHRPHEERRCRRPRARRLQGAELRRPCARCAGRGRAQAHPRRAHLCPPRAGRALPLYPREPQHRAAAGGARAGGRAEQRRGCRRCRQGARRSTARRTSPIASSRRRSRSCAASRVRKGEGAGRSRPSSPTWSAGAGIRATSATPTCWSTCRTSRSR